MKKILFLLFFSQTIFAAQQAQLMGLNFDELDEFQQDRLREMEERENNRPENRLRNYANWINNFKPGNDELVQALHEFAELYEQIGITEADIEELIPTLQTNSTNGVIPYPLMNNIVNVINLMAADLYKQQDKLQKQQCGGKSSR